MELKDIVIVGIGGFGREVKTIIDAINSAKLTYNILGFFDDNVVHGEIVNGYPVLGCIDDLNNYKSNISVVLGVGEPHLKRELVSRLYNKNIEFPSIIHPSAIIGQDDIHIRRGVIICAGCIATCNIKIKNFVTLNLCCTVGHDTKIGDYSSFMPTVNISGEVEIKECVYVGTGAKIINQLTIGENTIIGAGAVVAKSLPPNCTAVGIPAKPIKFH